ncbi:MAG: DUF3883 domain-containing protein [Actinobacteria bacterium]|jgi:hypothetical protein|nr:DUF3883 domain-containing protein [Actinomycetota bacterium]
MNFFKNLKYAHLQTLINLVNDTEEKRNTFIERRYSDTANKYSGSKEFLKELNLLSEENGRLDISLELQCHEEKLLLDEKIKTILLEQLLKTKGAIAKELKEYLKNFSDETSYCYNPSQLESLKYSDIRNFLIELGLIEYERTSNYYRISGKQLNLFETFLDNSKFSQTELDIELKRQKEIGMSAELQVIDYEKKRLRSQPDLVNKIKHVATDDVSAGYDILSWETKHDNGMAVPRYIEVKAVSAVDSKFYWSQHEVKKAKDASDKYYLYLLPVKSEKELCIEDINIIQDPAVKILNNPEIWITQVEKYEITQNN